MSDDLEIIRDEESYLPEITHEDRAGRARAWRIAGVTVLVLLVVLWVLVAVVGRVSRWREASAVYHQLQVSARTGQGIEAGIHALGATLTPGQVRVLVSGRSLAYDRLRDDQRQAFVALRPLEGPRAPATTPYQVLLRTVGKQRELHLVWQVPGTAEAVDRGVKL